MKRGLAIGLVAVSSLAVIAGAVFLLIPPVVSQTKQLAARAPGIWYTITHSETYGTSEGHLDEVLQRLPGWPATAGTVLTVLSGLLNGVAAAVSIFFLAIFMLLFGGQVVEALLGEAVPERRDRYGR